MTKMRKQNRADCSWRLTLSILRKTSLILLLSAGLAQAADYSLLKRKEASLAATTAALAQQKACQNGIFQFKGAKKLEDFPSAAYLAKYAEESASLSSVKVVYNPESPSQGIKVSSDSETDALVVFISPGEDGQFQSSFEDNVLTVRGDDKYSIVDVCTADNPWRATRQALARLQNLKQCFQDNNCTLETSSKLAFFQSAKQCKKCFKKKKIYDGWSNLLDLRNNEWVSAGPDGIFGTADDLSLSSPLRGCEVFCKETLQANGRSGSSAEETYEASSNSSGQSSSRTSIVFGNSEELDPYLKAFKKYKTSFKEYLEKHRLALDSFSFKEYLKDHPKPVQSKKSLRSLLGRLPSLLKKTSFKSYLVKHSVHLGGSSGLRGWSLRSQLKGMKID